MSSEKDDKITMQWILNLDLKEDTEEIINFYIGTGKLTEIPQFLSPSRAKLSNQQAWRTQRLR